MVSTLVPASAGDGTLRVDKKAFVRRRHAASAERSEAAGVIVNTGRGRAIYRLSREISDVVVGKCRG
jgi:hypothetical protein